LFKYQKPVMVVNEWWWGSCPWMKKIIFFSFPPNFYFKFQFRWSYYGTFHIAAGQEQASSKPSDKFEYHSHLLFGTVKLLNSVRDPMFGQCHVNTPVRAVASNSCFLQF
jgi:hypothetical protein